MKVLYLSPGGSAQGGAERSLAGLVAGMAANGHTPYVLLLAPGDASDLFAAHGAEIVGTAARSPVGAGTRHGSTLGMAVEALASAPRVTASGGEIRRLSRRLHADVVHSNGFRTHVLAPLLRVGGPPQVWSLRDRAPRPAQRAVLAAASRWADAVAATSAFTAAQLHGGARMVEVIANPVEIGAVPDRAIARRALGLPERGVVVAVVAHLHPSKGHHVAIEALARCPGGARPLLAIAGDRIYGAQSARYLDELRLLARSRGVADDVVFLGGVSEVELVYGAADVVVHPAVHPEGFGRVVVEAQLCGTPVVATGIGGVLELVVDGVTGLLVAPDDPQALIAGIESVLGDPELAGRLVANGRRAGQRFSREAHVERMDRLYRKVLAK